jgi:hypothetical protein
VPIDPTDRTQKEPCLPPPPEESGKIQNIHGEPLPAEIHGELLSAEASPCGEEILTQDLAALCVPTSLRHKFRRLSEMDEGLRPKNTKVIRDFFTKCRACTTHGDTSAVKLIDWDTVEIEFDTMNTGTPCMAWVKKNGTANTNMYFFFHGKNTLVRRILFEWFVGPTQLTEREKEAFQKKRSRSRKKPRRLSPSCSYDSCIHPWHLTATPPLPEPCQQGERLLDHIEEVSELEEEGEEEHEEVPPVVIGGQTPFEQAFARRCLLEAAKRSIFILEGIERRQSGSRKKRKRGSFGNSLESERRGDRGFPMKKPMLCEGNKPVVPFLYLEGGAHQNGYT